MHERLARSAATHLPVVYADLPFRFPAMKEMIQYHRTRVNDPGLAWLREEIARATRDAVFRNSIAFYKYNQLCK